MTASSLREMYVAQKAGFTPDRILFVGPSKSEAELREAIAKQIFLLVIESEQELLLADRIAGELDKTIEVAVRINPAFDAAGSKLKMGGGARQFGIDEEGIEKVLRRTSRLDHARVTGIHVYLGTRILDYEVAWKNTRYVFELAQRIRESAGIELRVIDFGGGLGVPYFAGEHEFDIEKFGEQFHLFFKDYYNSMPPARFIMEVGRYLVAESGIYVTRARYVKKSRGQTFVLVSGGLNHHQATTSIGALIKSHFPIENLSKMGLPKDEEVHVCGPLCTPADVLGKSVRMAGVEPGDLLGILKSGAYGLTASPIDFLLNTEPDLDTLLLVGAEKLVPPYNRVFGKMTLIGDSASAMVVRRNSRQCRPCGFKLRDFPDWWNAYTYSPDQLKHLIEFLTEEAALLLDEVLTELNAGWDRVALLIPPNFSLALVRLLSLRTQLSFDKIYSDNISRFGYLLTSDLAVNLSTALSEGRANKGDLVLALNLGLGLSLGDAWPLKYESDASSLWSR